MAPTLRSAASANSPASFQELLTLLDDLWWSACGVASPPTARATLCRTPRSRLARPRIARLLGWLDARASTLGDTSVPLPLRFRAAWETSPELCLDRDVEELTVAAVRRRVERDVRRLRRLADRPVRKEVLADIKRMEECYADPPLPRVLWMYLAESIRSAAEDYETLAGEHARSVGSSDPGAAWLTQVEYAAVVLDALAPGRARTLPYAEIQTAITRWPGRQRAHAGPGKWEAIASLVVPLKLEVSAATMAKKWPQCRKRVRLVRLNLMLTLHQGLTALRMAGRDGVVLATRRAVRLACRAFEIPPRREGHERARHNDPAPRLPLSRTTPKGRARPRPSSGARPDEAEYGAVPDSLWASVLPLLPPVAPRGAGRPRMNDRTALAGILYVLGSRRPWKETTSGEALRRRWDAWSDDVQRAVVDGALALGLLPDNGSHRGRVGYRQRRPRCA